MKKFFTIFALIFACYSSQAEAITRQEVLNNAAAYRDLQWTMKSCNYQNTCSSSPRIWTPFSSGTIVGMAYNWGGNTTPSDFINGLNSCRKAGNRCCSDNWGLQSNTIGVDCSGFVGRAWGLAAKYSTKTLLNISTAIQSSQLQAGDIINRSVSPGRHAVLFKQFASNGEPIVIEASKIDWKTSQRQRSWSSLSGYVSRKYNNITDTLQGTYKADYVTQANYPNPVVRGGTYTWWVEVRNTGTAVWTRDSIPLVHLGCGSASSPDQLYYIKHASWLDNYRPCGLDQASVAPNSVGRFTFKFTVPTNASLGWSQRYYFNPVAEGVTWMRRSNGTDNGIFMQYYVVNSGESYSGYLSGTGQWQWQPNGAYYYSSQSGVHYGRLEGPSNTDFDLYLYKWDGSDWQKVNSSTSYSSIETINYSGGSGYYIWGVYSYSGSGNYSLSITKPN